jgi:hypothetical protein
MSAVGKFVQKNYNSLRDLCDTRTEQCLCHVNALPGKGVFKSLYKLDKCDRDYLIAKQQDYK